MDPQAYKDVVTSRGLTYHYFFSPASDGKPTVIFMHGFPSTSYDWRYQIDFLKPKGYGIIAPDMLGYGGSSKPTDPALYTPKGTARDMIDILDAEKIDKAIVAGHDWGSPIADQTTTDYPDRVIGGIFLAVCNGMPLPSAEVLEATNTATKDALGYEIMGYWFFMSEPEARTLLEENLDNFFNILYADDPKTWTTDFAPLGAMRRRLESKEILPNASYIPEEERKIARDELAKGGMAGPVCWYRVRTTPGLIEPRRDPVYPMPIFFGAAAHDYIALAAPAKASVEKNSPHPKTRIREFQTGHWVQLEKPHELNKEILEWIESL